MDEKNDVEVKETEVKTEEKKEETKKKGGAGKIVMIVLGILLVIILLCGGVAFFAYRGAAERVEEVENVWEEIGQEIEREMGEVEHLEEETFETEQEELTESEYPKVDDELLDQNLISERFPEDIPLSGGQVRDSSFDRWSVNVNIMTSSSVEEAFLWYEEAMEDTDWIITSKSRQDDRASINFENELEDDDFRRGEISITESWREYTNVMVRERY